MPPSQPLCQRPRVVLGCLVLVVAAGAAAGCGSGSSPVTSPVTSSGPRDAPSRTSPGIPVAPTRTAVPAAPACVGGVTVTAGEADAALGLRAMPLTLVNCGTRPYRLNGYPELRVLDETQRQARVRIVHGPTEVKDAGPAPLTLAPRQAATVVLVWRNTVTEASDPPVKGVFLEVTPASGRTIVVVRPDVPLDLGTTGVLKTTAWAPRR